ncbi:MAG: MgtC/SapB family protein [Polymorphobacter sp.]
MDSLHPLVALALSLGIGLIIGTERGWQLRDEPSGNRVAGLRTYAIVGVIGGIAGMLAVDAAMPATMRWLAVAASAGVVAALVLGYRTLLRGGDAGVSATGTIVSILTLMLGALATAGYATAAVVTAGVVTLLLSLRDSLHGWLHGLTPRDMRAAVQYVVIVCVIWPLLPDHAFGPYDAWNLRTLWLVVVFVTGLSFAGYVASKRLGTTRGTVAAAAIGATYSSTAVSAELARRLRAPGETIDVLRAGIAAATAVMALRVIVLAAVLVPVARLSFSAIMAPAAVFACGYALVAARHADAQDGKPMSARNPFDFWPAVGFAALIAAVIVLARWAIDQYGDSGLTTVVALTGFYDVDAAIIMLGNLPASTMPARAFGLLLALPVLINTLWKAAIVVTLGGRSHGWGAATPLFIVAALLAATLVAAWRW